MIMAASCAFAADFSKVVFTGVWERTSDYARSSAPAAGFSVSVTGGSVSAELEGEAFFEIFVDGVDQGFVRTSERKVYPIAKLQGKHLVEVFHRSESLPGDFKVYSVKVEGGELLEQSVRLDRKVAFIGDSYTVGYGVEANGPEDGTPFEQTNTTKAYSFLLSRKLKADYRIFAFSGRGLVRNYAGIVPDWTIPKLIEHTVPGMAHEGKGGPAYDTSWHPKVVVVFIGINDFQGDAPRPTEDEFVKEYHRLLAKLRLEHKGVKFLLLSTRVWPESLLIPAVERVYNEELAAGNNDVSLKSVVTENGALHGHPSKHSQAELAQELLPIVARLGGWLSR